MLIKTKVLAAIKQGDIQYGFRCWKKPTVRSGGTLQTALGQLSIVKVERVSKASIKADDAKLAGYSTRQELLKELQRRTDGAIYKITFGGFKADPRIELRAQAELDEVEVEALVIKLERMDRRAEIAWTTATLDLIAHKPSTRAGDLCQLLGQDKDKFKANVRKLKALGLTESLEVGYQISPRGRVILNAILGAEEKRPTE